jgi:hypothetical protein
VSTRIPLTEICVPFLTSLAHEKNVMAINIVKITLFIVRSLFDMAYNSKIDESLDKGILSSIFLFYSFIGYYKNIRNPLRGSQIQLYYLRFRSSKGLIIRSIFLFVIYKYCKEVFISAWPGSS